MELLNKFCYSLGMNTSNVEGQILFGSDALVLLVSLWLTLVVRYQGMPSLELFYAHLVPFLLIFVAWFMVYVIAGLYEKQSTLWKKRLPARLFRAQLINAGIAVLFFYLLPFFSISPKIVLLLYVVISSLLLITMRMLVLPALQAKNRQAALLVAGGQEKNRLIQEVNTNVRYGIYFSRTVDLDSTNAAEVMDVIAKNMDRAEIAVAVIDLDHPKIQQAMQGLYSDLFSKVLVINFNKLYESIFDCIPLSSVTHGWFLEHVSLQPRYTYDLLKRVMDITLASVAFVVTLPLCALAYVLIKLDDGGPVLIKQERIGEGNKIIKIAKFRSMTTDDAGKYGSTEAKINKITRVGGFLRKSRIDELPQLWSVIRGDQSLIGPRPELTALGTVYEKEIPYYNVRHLIKPGLSGWAQIYADHGHGAVATEVTKEKLSYDLFYVKNRSFFLDCVIALKTIQILLSFVGK